MIKPNKQGKITVNDYKLKQAGEDLAAIEQQRESIANETDYLDIVGRRVEQAMREGQFDKLRGKGKPLQFKQNPFVPADQQLAYDILENNDLAPGWIVDRSALLRTIENFRAELRQAVGAYQARRLAALDGPAQAKVAEAWQRERTQWAEKIKELNRRIQSLNLVQPIAHLEVFKLLLDDELVRAGWRE